MFGEAEWSSKSLFTKTGKVHTETVLVLFVWSMNNWNMWAASLDELLIVIS